MLTVILIDQRFFIFYIFQFRPLIVYQVFCILIWGYFSQDYKTNKLKCCLQDKESLFFTRVAERQQEARGKVVIQRLVPPIFRLWPMRPKEFHSGLRPLREF